MEEQVELDPQWDRPPAQLMVRDKKALKAWRLNHELHVLSLMQKHGLSKPDAIVQAYHEGFEHRSTK